MRILSIAPFSEDRLSIDGIESIRAGGPALFISDTLRSFGVDVVTCAGPHPAVVHITIEKGKERGELVFSSHITAPAVVSVDATIISTVGTEFALNEVPVGAGFVALDVQGYIRSRAGREELAASTRVFDCVKATEVEITLLDPTFVDRQKQRELLVTRGSRGATVWTKGIAYDIPVRSVPTKNPLGAGDRFLAAYVVGHLQGRDPDVAGAFAAEHVSRCLADTHHMK